MKKIFTFTLTALLGLQGFSQTKHSREVAHFTGIQASSAIKVVVTMSDKESLAIEAEAATLPHIKTEVKNNVLHIYCEGNTENKKQMVAYVIAKELVQLTAGEAASIDVINPVNCGDFKLEARGAATIKIDLKAKELRAKESGASTVQVKGSAGSLVLDLSGASTFKGKEMDVITADVKATGASSAKLSAKETLKAHADGASSIIYHGEPKNVVADEKGASSIKKA